MKKLVFTLGSIVLTVLAASAQEKVTTPPAPTSNAEIMPTV